MFVILLGFPVLLIAIPFAKNIPSDEDNDVWHLRKLPSWAWLWSNDNDGTLGDKRGSWRNRVGNPESFWNQFWWLGIRNPANNFSRKLLHAPSGHVNYIGDFFVTERRGLTGHQFVWSVHNGIIYPGFYLVKIWFNTNKCIRIRMGFKLRPDYDEDGAGFATSLLLFDTLHD